LADHFDPTRALNPRGPATAGVFSKKKLIKPLPYVSGPLFAEAFKRCETLLIGSHDSFATASRPIQMGKGAITLRTSDIPVASYPFHGHGNALSDANAHGGEGARFARQFEF
jgi:hypothetical protein